MGGARSAVGTLDAVALCQVALPADAFGCERANRYLLPLPGACLAIAATQRHTFVPRSLAIAGGMGEAVWAWDLRAGRAQALYELSTGNARVLALAWHQGSSSLLASCESMYDDCHEDWAGGSDGEGEGGSGSRWWPKRAKHDRKDFKAYWTEADSCVVQYRFSDRAGGAVPESQGPAFGWQGFE